MTYHVSSLGVETAPNLIFAKALNPALPETHTATTGRLGNAFTVNNAVVKGRLVPPMQLRTFQPQAIDHASRTLTFPPRTIGDYDVWRSGWLDGADVIVFRNDDGQAVQVGQTRVTASEISQILPLHSSERAMPAGATEFRWSPPGWYRRGAVMWIAVAALDADGRCGPWSMPVSYTVGAAAAVQDNTDPALLVAVPDLVHQDRTDDIPAPSNVQAISLNDDRTVQVTWTPVPGLRHVVARSYTPEFRQIETLTVEDSSFMRESDLFTFRKRFDHTHRAENLLVDRVWDVSAIISRFGMPGLGGFADRLPEGVSYEFMSDEDGPFIRLKVASGHTHPIQSATHAGTEQGWYAVLDPGRTYNIHTVLRASAHLDLTLRVNGVGVADMTRAVTTEWTAHDAEFTPASLRTNSTPQYSQILVKGPAQLDVRQFTVGLAGTAPFAATPAEKETLLNSAAGHIRFHTFCKTSPWSYTMDDLLSDVGVPATQGCSLPQHLRILKDLRDSPEGRELATRAGHPILNPWLQFEAFMTDDELAMLGGFLCTPYDPDAADSPTKRGAARRVSQGQVRPWQDEFDSLRIEIGNENWNPLAGFFLLPSTPGTPGGAWNGLLLDRTAGAIMAAPGYQADKFSYYLGGWAVNEGWNRTSIAASRHADFVGYADYNGGWDSGLSAALSADDPAAVQATLANTTIPMRNRQPRLTRMPRLVNLCHEMSQGRAKPIRAMHYEAGPGYVMDGLNGASATPEQIASQERLLKSVAGGTATLDAFLYNSSVGVVSTNFFTLEEGDYWKARAKWEHGGAFNPAYQWFCFANQYLGGRISLLQPHLVQVLNDGDGKAQGDAVRVYLVQRKDGTRAFAIVNVDPLKQHEVRVRLAGHKGGWTRHHMTGDMMTSNITAETAASVTILSEDMPDGWGAGSLDVTIPPGKTEVYIERV
ncbi:MAG: hypothetical protein Q4G49_15905 [Paracoccus sp. (in: a-proteobacteria)]|nr:hypothetical protein [Paracoccus sp. (in: a-proteobacteria)]